MMGEEQLLGFLDVGSVCLKGENDFGDNGQGFLCEAKECWLVQLLLGEQRCRDEGFPRSSMLIW